MGGHIACPEQRLIGRTGRRYGDIGVYARLEKRVPGLQGLELIADDEGVHYIGVHLHPYYREQFGFLPEDFPNATWISERTVSIPLSPKLTEADVEDVIGAVKVAVS